MHRFWWTALVDDAKAIRPVCSSSHNERSSGLNNRAGHVDGQVAIEDKGAIKEEGGCSTPKEGYCNKESNEDALEGRDNEREHRLVEHDMSGDDAEASVALVGRRMPDKPFMQRHVDGILVELVCSVFIICLDLLALVHV